MENINLKRLQEPFPPEVVSFRIGSVKKGGGKATALFYIDARDVRDRLDFVCGPENWQCRYPIADPSTITHSETKEDKWGKPIVISKTQGKTICELGIRINDEWVWKSDGAGDSDVESEKGAISDALKRAAVCWGVGRYLYDLPSPWVEIDEYKNFTDEAKRKLLDILRGSSAPMPKNDRFYAIKKSAISMSLSLDNAKSKDQVTHIVVQNTPLLLELKTNLPGWYEKLSVKINQTMEAFDLAEKPSGGQNV